MIGATAYEETETVSKKLEKKQYAILAEGNKIVVYAKSNQILEEAIYCFIEQLIPRNVKESGGKFSLYHEDFLVDYEEPSEPLFNGEGLSKYAIVYSKNVPGMEEHAQDLATRIKSALKLDLDCYPDTFREETEYEILVGLTNRDYSVACFSEGKVPLLSYQLIVDGTKIQFAAAGAYSMDEMLSSFILNYVLGTTMRNLRDGVYMETDLLPIQSQPLTEGSTLRVMTSNVLAEKWKGDRGYPSIAARAEMYAATLYVYRPHLIGIQETDEPWFENLPYYLNYLKDYLYLDYEWIQNIYPYDHDDPPTDGLPIMTSIIYSKEQFTYVKSGMQEFSDGWHAAYKLRVLTYVILTHKESGEKYALVNTHYDGQVDIAAREIVEQASLVTRLKNKYSGIHVFCTGDYNNHKAYDINDLRKALNMLTTKEMAKTNGTLINEVAGIPEGIYIDHIFSEKTNVIMRHETIDVNFANLLSDHCLQYADVIVK